MLRPITEKVLWQWASFVSAHEVPVVVLSIAIAVKGLDVLHYTLIPLTAFKLILRLLFSLAVKWHKF